MGASRIKGQCAAGPDGIALEIIKAVVRSHPEACLAAMNKSLRKTVHFRKNGNLQD